MPMPSKVQVGRGDTGGVFQLSFSTPMGDCKVYNEGAYSREVE